MKKINFRELVMLEDDDYLLINKPHDISSLDERDITRPSIVRMAREYHADAQLCHRLDKETSGVLAIAKNPEAYRNLSMQFQRRQVQKVYHAVVEGLHEFNQQLVDLPLARSGKSTMRVDKNHGVRSETILHTLQLYKMHTLVACSPKTGRMHQIRVHLAACKAPIVSDGLYGGKPFYLSAVKRKYRTGKFTEEEQPFMKRIALHAFSLEFQGLNGQPVKAEAPWFKDFRALLAQLEKNS